MVEKDFLDKDLKKDALNAGIYTAVVVLYLIIAFYSFTAGRAAENQLNFIKLAVFSIPYFAFILAIWVIKIGRHYNASLNKVFLIVHDPEYSIYPNFFKRGFLLLIISLILFGILSFVGAVFAQSAVGNIIYPLSPVTFQQQVAPYAETYFSFYNAPAENAFLYIILAFIVTIELFIARKIQISRKITYFIMILPNAIFAGFIWLKIHALVTGGDQVQTLAHYFFGFNGALMTMLTGSIIPFDVYHIFNNLFNNIKGNFGNEALLILSGMLFGVIVLLFFIWFFYFRSDSK